MEMVDPSGKDVVIRIPEIRIVDHEHRRPINQVLIRNLFLFPFLEYAFQVCPSDLDATTRTDPINTKTPHLLIPSDWRAKEFAQYRF